MRIKQISVNGLFGIFDHVIPLKRDERITVIHSLNGFGKTAILRILNGFFNSEYSQFKKIPFKNFKVELDNDQIIDFKYSQKAGNIDISYNILTSDKLFSITIPMVVSNQEPEWLKKLQNSIRIRLIESQRLNFFPNLSSTGYPRNASMQSTVSAYSNALAKLMQDKIKEYGTTSQSLDRTFPLRVVKRQPLADVTNEQLRQQLDKVESTRSSLIEIGFLDKDEGSESQIQPQDIDESDESTKKALSLYIKDVEQKLNVFAKTAKRIHLLRKIINKKFASSYKEINFSKEKGFVFTTLHKQKISPRDLSSGEQHELVLLFGLLFKAKPNSLVLIDEPELSLHVAWQVEFLKDLKEITELADLDILMATHSPDIIQERWDLTVELKGLDK
ncbi:MAG: AAA family ATPase [Cyanobacteria bacterium P01_H01_bin.35]